MRRVLPIKRRLHFFSYHTVFRLAGALLILTMFSVWLTCGLFAKFSVRESFSDSATVASISDITMLEHKVETISDKAKMLKENSVYTLSKTETTKSNTYYAVPGTVIPKDPYIELSGNNDVSCTLYIEVANGGENFATFTIDSKNWTEVEQPTSDDSNATIEFSPRHNGVVYRYNSTIQAHEQKTIKDIIVNNSVSISDTYANKKLKDSNNFSIDFYAYLVQED